MAKKQQPATPDHSAGQPNPPSNAELLEAANFELQETKAALAMAQMQLRSQPQPQATAPRNSLDPKSLEHPHAFMAQDGRTYYKYKDESGDTIITPKPIEEMTEQDFYQLPISMIDVQVNRMQQNLTVTFKDPQWAGFWFNRVAGKGTSAGVGRRVGQARALGFVPAKIEDLAIYPLHLNDQDGAVEQDDVVLMKIHKAKLYGRYASLLAYARKEQGIDAYKNAAVKGLNPKVAEAAPYYHTPQATGEFQGLGPVAHIPTVNR